MLRSLLGFLGVPLLMAVGSDGTSLELDGEREITDLIAGLEEAWADGDAAAYASHFQKQAQFTVWFGLRLMGRDQIEHGHQMIFNEIYKNTRLKLEIDDIRFLTSTTALISLSGWIIHGEEQPASEPEAAPLAVAQVDGGEWKLAAFQNTPYVVEQFRSNGDLGRFKRLANSLAFGD